MAQYELNVCSMLGMFAVKSAVLSGFVSDSVKLARILDLSLNTNALFEDAFQMEPLVNLSKNQGHLKQGRALPMSSLC